MFAVVHGRLEVEGIRVAEVPRAAPHEILSYLASCGITNRVHIPHYYRRCVCRSGRASARVAMFPARRTATDSAQRTSSRELWSRDGVS